MTFRPLRLAGAVFAGALAAMALAASAGAQQAQDPTDKRIDALEKQVRQLKSILTQARDTGQPVSVRLTNEPDPTVETLQQRVDDLEQAARSRNEQIDTLAHDTQVARKDAADARAAAQAVQDRMTRIEQRLGAIGEDAASAPPSQPQAYAPQSYAPPPGPSGSLGTLPAPPPPQQRPAPPPQAGPTDAFAKAKQLLLGGEYAAASGAFQDFVDKYPDTAQAPEAYYWLGETLFIRGLYSDAALAYGSSVRGWPQTTWAPDAVVKLARSLVALQKAPDACKVLNEFTRRYPNAAQPVKARAASARTQAACAA